MRKSKVLAIILVVAMMFSFSIAASAARIDINAPQGTPTIDGVKDAVYSDLIPVDKIYSFDDVTTTGATGKYAFAWDSNFIYVYVEVVDTTPCHEEADDHEQDSCEVFIDWYNTQADTADNGEGPYWLVRFHSDITESPMKVTGYQNGDNYDTYAWGAVAEGIEAKVVGLNGDLKNGYVVEAKLPKADIAGGMEFKEGTVISVCFGINDNQGETRLTGAYPSHVEGDASWNAPVNHGYLLKLVGAGGGATETPKEDVKDDQPEAKDEAPKQTPPKTGDAGMIALIAVMALAATGVVVLRRKAVK